MSDVEAAHVRVLTANTHVGQAVSPGFAAQVHLLQPDVVLMQEVIDQAIPDVMHLFSKRFHIIPGFDHRDGRESFQTPILLDKERFKLTGEGNQQISPWRGGGDHGRLWPTRYGTQASAVDRETDRIINVRNVHTWALGSNPPRDVVQGHHYQVDHAADWARRKPNNHVVFAAGDFNENLDSGEPYAVHAMETAGMKRAGKGMEPADAHTSLHAPIYLDDVFYKGTGVRVVNHAIKKNAAPGADHMMVVVTFSVTHS